MTEPVYEPDSEHMVQAGEIVSGYQILDPTGFAGVLPTAVILEAPNAGVTVIMTSRDRRRL